MCQLKQIEDRNKKIASEEDEDEMWHQVLTQMTNEQVIDKNKYGMTATFFQKIMVLTAFERVRRK